MLDRNRRIKLKPERFQDVVEEFDIIFTVEERIYDTVVEGMFSSYSDVCNHSILMLLPRVQGSLVSQTRPCFPGPAILRFLQHGLLMTVALTI